WTNTSRTEQPMRYQKLLWHNPSVDQPIEIYSEIDDEDWEVRKVEFFRHGPPAYASATERVGTDLADQTIPRDLVKTTRLEPYDISQQQFEEVWTKAREQNR